jgi:hypothetical protein
MALADFTYRLKPQSGDTTAHDEKGVSGDLTGGTITLQDMGSGDYAWRFVGAASVAGPSRTMTNATGGGLTVAWRLRVPTYGTVNRDRLIGYGPSAGITSALRLAKDNNSGDFDVRSEGAASPTLGSAPLTGMGTAIRTIVLKITQSATDSADVIKLWMDKVGRSGSTPDLVTAGFNHTVASAFNKIYCGGATGTIDVADFVVWGEELSDADCAALADTGIRATLDASSTITLTPDPTTAVVGGTRTFTITRNNAAGAGGVTYNLSSSNTGVATVPATATILEGNTSITFNATGAGVGSANITATNAADSGETDTAALTVSAPTTTTLKLLAHIDALGATAVKGSVFQPGTGGNLLGAKIGDFTGEAFESVAESGQAPLLIPVTSFGGGSLTVSDTPVVVWEATSAAGSALGAGVAIGSVGPHECTVVEI